MTRDERDELAILNTRLFGLNGDGGLYGDVQDIKSELAEWRGAIRIVKYAGSILGLGGIGLILRAIMGPMS